MATPRSLLAFLIAAPIAVTACGRFLETPATDAGASAPTETTPAPNLPRIDAPDTSDVPSAPCDGSTKDACLVLCSTASPCVSPIVCPTDRACRVVCSGDGCRGGEMLCASGMPCTLDCQGSGACLDLVVRSDVTGQLRVRCDDLGGDSCSTLMCDVPSPAWTDLLLYCTRNTGDAGATFGASCLACKEKAFFVP